MKITDFEYRGEYSFFAYRFLSNRRRQEILSPNNSTTLKQVIFDNPCEVELSELLIIKNNPCILIITSGFKHTLWHTADGSKRVSCFSMIEVEDVDKVIIEKKDQSPDEMFIIQGDLTSIDRVSVRTPKDLADESTVIKRRNVPQPGYIDLHSGEWAISNNNSDTTVVNMADGSWWFGLGSYNPWYHPYLPTWRKAGYNVLSWRTPGDQQFCFGFDKTPKETAEEHSILIKQLLPKTKRVIYFGQCLGSSKTIQTAYEFGADFLYTSSTMLDPMNHRTKFLMDLSPYETTDAIEYLQQEDLPESVFIYKYYDHCEREEHSRVLYEYGGHKDVEQVLADYDKPWAPVAGDIKYNIFKYLNRNPPGTMIDM